MNANRERTLAPFELRRTPARRGSDWLDEVTADVCGDRAWLIVLQTAARDGNLQAAATLRHAHQVFADV
jgi:hypothetical protein